MWKSFEFSLKFIFFISEIILSFEIPKSSNFYLYSNKNDSTFSKVKSSLIFLLVMSKDIFE